MTQPLRIAFIGNSLPRRCGIATFTTDLQEAVSALHPRVKATIVAMNDRDRSYAYPPAVRAQIRDDRLEEYVRAAEELNTRRLDAVCLQHEFGIFGGEAGANVLTLLSRLNMPIVTTLHTVLAEPSPVQRKVFGDIVALSAKVVVMAEKGRELLRQEIDGAGEPARLDIDIAGVRRLTIHTDWGKYGDRNDELDLCEARITK